MSFRDGGCRRNSSLGSGRGRRSRTYARVMSATAARVFDAVLFDWCGTLVEHPAAEDRFRRVLERSFGDNPEPDTGAAALGIATLIHPLQRDPRPPLLERVLALALPGR